ncbi:MAG: site-specific integrase [Bacteroidota bacterium]
MSATINLRLWKYRAKKDGLFPIYIRFTKNRKSSWVSTNVSVKAKEWDEGKGKIRPGHPNSARLNAYLKQVELKYQNDVIEIENKNLQVGMRGIKQKLLGKDASFFVVVANELITSYKQEGKISSHDRSVSITNKFKKYMQSDVFTFQDIDIRLLLNYQTYLIDILGNKPSSINRDIKFIKTVFRYAHRMEYISFDVNPFLKFKFLKTNSERGFLTPDEIGLIEKTDCSGIPYIQRAKDIILFQYYSGGLRISDALLIRWENVIGERIYLTIKKTGKQTSHKLTPKALSIIEKYRVNNTQFIFGYFPDGFNLEDLVKVDSEISAKTALVNKALKKIAEFSGIKKRLSTHLLRHSFATNALQQGMSLEVLQSILKHSNIRETQIYAKVLNQKVDAEIDKLTL